MNFRSCFVLEVLTQDMPLTSTIMAYITKILEENNVKILQLEEIYAFTFKNGNQALIGKVKND